MIYRDRLRVHFIPMVALYADLLAWSGFEFWFIPEFLLLY